MWFKKQTPNQDQKNVIIVKEKKNARVNVVVNHGVKLKVR